MQFDNPLIIQSDRTILLDVHAPRAKECQAALIPFAELERSPEHLHTYRLTPPPAPALPRRMRWQC